TPDLSDQNSDANVQVLAKALVYARTGQSSYRDEVINALRIITHNNTESGGRTLALGRELVAYVIAADLIDLGNADADLDAQFRNKLRALLTMDLSGLTLQSTHEVRPNNWGTHAGASRAAVALYLGDSSELARTAEVFHGWLGNRTAYSGFSYGDLSWQADSNNPVGINPRGAIKEGHNIDGALPEEMRRGGSFQWPPAATGYAWEGLQGALVQAELLHRAGYPVWEWEDRALLRAVEFLYRINWPAMGDDAWQLWLVNHAYGVSYPADPAAQPGKNMGWTSWTHSVVSPQTNQPPTVDAGGDQQIALPTAANLNGSASDDGLPNPPAVLTTTWSVQSGPAAVSFDDKHARQTTASFTVAGTYVLRLTADDGELSATDDMTVTVSEPAPN
ncbi:MAG: alginate lyase family protein, partial [Caldilineaceae bacterium]|nr:alginate lyase family protein [Caldilineaceae bacterium]